MNRKLLYFILIFVIILYVYARIIVGGWLFLSYWYLFIFVPILHIFIQLKILYDKKYSNYLFVILGTHFLFLIFILLQFDIGDGLYHVFLIEIISIFNKKIADQLNIESSYLLWNNLQIIVGIILTLIEISLIGYWKKRSV